MAVELESIIARLRANTSEMRRGFDQMVRKARTSTQRMSESFDRLGQRVSSVGKKLVVSITAPFAVLVGFSIKTASEVQELQNLLSVTFGDATDDVRAWADATAVAVNRSTASLLKATGEFAAFLQPLGVAPDRIKPMSQALAQLTVDIASFRDKTEEEVLIRLFSGLAGETEAVRRLGIDIEATKLEIELFNLGFEGTIDKATQAQKVVARFNRIITDTRKAQGDAVRTSEQFQNAFKGLQAVIFDLRVGLGERFLPVATDLVIKLNEIGRTFLALSSEAQKNILIFGGIAAATGPVLLVFGTLIRLIGFAISGLVIFASTAIKTFALVARGAVALIAPFLTIPGAIAVIAASVFVFRDTVGAAFKSIAEFAMAVVQPLVQPIRTAFINITQIVGLIQASIMAGITSFGNSVGAVFENIVVLAQTLTQPLVEPIRLAFGFIKEIVADVQKFVFDRLNNIIGFFNGAVAAVGGLIGKTIEPIISKFGEVSAEVREFVTDLPEFNFTRIKIAATQDLDDIKDLFRNTIDGIKSLLPQGAVDLAELLKTDKATIDLDELESKLNEIFQIFLDLGANANDALGQAGLKAKDLAEDLRQAFIGRLADVKDFGDAMTAVFDRLKAQLLEIAFFGTTGKGGLFGGIFSSIASSFAGFFGGARADGGPVQQGRSFLVGERGPELFIPRTGGRIVNASTTAAAMKRDGDIIIHQTINLPPDNTEITERMVTIGAVMRDQAISAMRQARNQGF